MSSRISCSLLLCLAALVSLGGASRGRVEMEAGQEIQPVQTNAQRQTAPPTAPAPKARAGKGKGKGKSRRDCSIVVPAPKVIRCTDYIDVPERLPSPFVQRTAASLSLRRKRAVAYDPSTGCSFISNAPSMVLCDRKTNKPVAMTG